MAPLDATARAGVKFGQRMRPQPMTDETPASSCLAGLTAES